MGIFDKLKRLLLKREPKKDSLKVEEINSALPRAFPEEQKKEDPEKIYRDLDIEPKKRPFTEPEEDLGQQLTKLKAKLVQEKGLELEEPKRVSIAEQSTHMAIKQWEDTIKAAQQHPLSQAKILNTQILEDLHSVLKAMNNRLDRLDDLDKLDSILQLLRETKENMDAQGLNVDQLDQAIEQIDQLTIKDKEVLEWVSRQERVTAQQLSDYINLSRSTASFRLNRLEDLGALDKEAVGKKIYYKIKKGDKN